MELVSPLTSGLGIVLFIFGNLVFFCALTNAAITRRFIVSVVGFVIALASLGASLMLSNSQTDALNEEFSTKLEQEYGATSNKDFASIYRDIRGKGSLETPVTFTRDGVDTKVLVKNMSDSNKKFEVVFLTLDEKQFYPKKES